MYILYSISYLHYISLLFMLSFLILKCAQWIGQVICADDLCFSFVTVEFWATGARLVCLVYLS